MLEVYWIGMNQSSDLFHAHEWDKHGTCWNDPYSNDNQSEIMNDYFGTAMQVAFKLDFYNTLENGGITPSEDPYQLSDFTEYLNSVWGENTYTIDCTSDGEGNWYLLDINVCLSLTYEIMQCPSYVSNTCPSGPIIYPPIDL